MREIKFRAWHEGNKEMYYVPTLNIWDDVLLHWWEGKPFPNGYTKSIELMQYTGLKDKNGKEIYEGDIIQTKQGIREVKWGTSWAAINGQMEVIGNQFENKELLK